MTEVLLTSTNGYLKIRLKEIEIIGKIGLPRNTSKNLFDMTVFKNIVA